MKIQDAVINIGSNSVKLLAPSDAPFNFRHSITTQLALGAQNGILDANAMERTATAVKELYDAALSFHPRSVLLYATEAVRSATNAGDLLRKISRSCPLTADVLDGETEARIAYLGAKQSFDTFDALLDIGGASTELLCADTGHVTFQRSLPVGAVRLYDKFKDDYTKLKPYTQQAVSPFQGLTLPAIVGVSGTFSTLAVIALSLKRYDAAAVHGFTCTAEQLETLTQNLLPLSPQEICRRNPPVNLPRANVLKAGLAILNSVAEAANTQKITVSVSDGLEGYLVYKGLA